MAKLIQQVLQTIQCDRCKTFVAGEIVPGPGGVSFGVYDTAPGSFWNRFAHVGENVLCDACMWADPDYITLYGKRG